jgi:conjugal transfer pilus assembly protein TraB
MLEQGLQMSMEVIKKRQNMLMLCLIVALSIVVIILGFFLFSKKSHTTDLKHQDHYKSNMMNASSRIDPKEIWVERFTSENDFMTKRLDQIEKMIKILVKEAEDKEEKNTNPEGFSLADIPSSGAPIEGLRSTLKEAVHEVSLSQKSEKNEYLPQQNVFPPALGNGGETSYKTFKKRPHTKGIHRISLSLSNSKSHKNLKTTDNTIPAGAFASAILLGGVDASTSIQSSSDPRPILLRLTDPGTLPRHFRSDLCGCHVLAASYGDISSERVFMRLEKMTCTEVKTGEIVEMNVSGYVAGEDGRAGLRGTVVDRAGESVRHAAIGGFLGGIGNFFSQPNNPLTYSLNSGLAQTNAMTGGDLFKHGVAKGTGTALEKYADFYIKRAEQMQPVIQVQAGRIVDIVFTQGVSFEDSAARSALVSVNDQSRYAQIQSQTQTHEISSKPITAWTPAQGDAS